MIVIGLIGELVAPLMRRRDDEQEHPCAPFPPSF